MEAGSLPTRIMIDCSHANANKDHERQALVALNVAEQLASGNESIIGIMLESHINAGNQSLKDPNNLEYGVSITDACIDWDTTEELMMKLYDTLSTRVY